jgi:hypothetical protein
MEIKVQMCTICHRIMEMNLNTKNENWFKMRHPRQIIGFTHHNNKHHNREKCPESFNHVKKVKIIRTKK